MSLRPRVLITGGGGQLARAFLEGLEKGGGGAEAWAPARTELDVAEAESVRAAVAFHRPDWIVNCAAFTAVDAAEGDPAAAYRVNDAAVGILADAAREKGARLLHISTDYVFDGRKDGPYVEDDPPAPMNVYGASKLAGEERLRRHPARSAILRTAWLYGEGPRNFLGRIVQRGRQALEAGEPLPVVSDQVGTPTDVHTLAAQMEEVMRRDLQGLYHAAALGEASWLEFARAIFEGLGLTPELVPIRGEDLGRPAPRASRVVLLNRNLQTAGCDRMIPWRDGLRGVLERLEAAPRRS